MSKAEQAVKLFTDGFSCSQAMMGAFGPELGLPLLECLRVGSGFGGGMHQNRTCGVVTGAVMVLGLRHGPKEATDAAHQQVYDRTSEFFRRFQARCGSSLCTNLLGCDLSTPEGLQHARKNNLFQTKCTEYVRAAGEILEAMK
ncbi:MAG: C_GCAxxG_C_C family protein [Sedimentisphaerales bacterium]|nr:C_GCAxxG_C_C family protein [Sedimentisphaerales bacterium]